MLRLHPLAVLVILASCAGNRPDAPVDAAPNSADTADTANTADTITCPNGLVFWSDDDICAPHVDGCEAWEVPIIGGGCMAVGPRACPKLWDPEADVDCEPGEMRDYEGEPCPVGLVLTDDEVACIPFFEEAGVCGDLEIPMHGGGCQRVGPEWDVLDPPLFDECSHGEVPLISGGCERLLPLAADCPAGPFPPAPDGATDLLYVVAGSACAVDCGSDAAPYPSIQAAITAAPAGAAVLVGQGTYDEGLTITEPVHVVGLCSAVVEVTGDALVLPRSDDSKVLEAGVGIYDTVGVSLAGLRVRSAAAGVALVGATDVLIEDVDIVESSGVSLYVDGGSVVAARDLWIHDSETGSGEMGYGRGIWAGGGAELDVQSVLIENTRRTGIEVEGDGTGLDLADAVLRNTDPGGSDDGMGIAAREGCTVSVSGSLLEENRAGGLIASHPGTAVEISGSVIRWTSSNGAGQGGWGVEAYDGSTMTITGCLLQGNTVTGVGIYHEATQLFMSETIVEDTRPDGAGSGGYGLQLAEGASATVSDCIFRGLAGAGVAAFHSGTEAIISGSVVKEPDVGSTWGQGMQISDGASLEISSSLIDGSRSVGLLARDHGTHVDLMHTAIRDTQAVGDDHPGVGIQVSHGATAAISGCLFQGNAGDGLGAYHPGTYVDLSGTMVTAVRADRTRNESTTGAVGMRVMGSAAAAVTGCLFDQSKNHGLKVLDPGTVAVVSNTVVRATYPEDGEDVGYGLLAAFGSTVTASNCLFEANIHAGVIAVHSDTLVETEGSIVRDTKSKEDAWREGIGVGVVMGASASLSGCLVEGNVVEGIAVQDDGSEITIAGTIVRETVPSHVDFPGMPDEFGGFGLAVLYAAEAMVRMSLFQRNTTAGVGVVGTDSALFLEDSAVLDTIAGGTGIDTTRGWESQVFGDGILVIEGAAVDVDSTVLTGNERTGALYHESSGEIRHSVVTRNGSYGLAMVLGDEKVVWDDATNYFFGNAFDLPAGIRAEVTAAPGSIPIPQVPKPFVHDG